MTENSGECDASRRIAIGIGGTSSKKHWPYQKYGELIKVLLEEDDEYRFLIIRDPEGHEEAKIISGLVGERCVADLFHITMEQVECFYEKFMPKLPSAMIHFLQAS